MVTWGSRLGLVVVAGVVLVSTGCDPETGELTIEGGLSVETAVSCSVEGDCMAMDFVVGGDGFTPDTTLKVFIPGGQVDGVPEIVFSSGAHVGGSGGFAAIEKRVECLSIPRPGDARGTLSLVADDTGTGARRAFTFVDSGAVICQPPFVRLTYTQPCGQPLCPTLSNDGPTTIWMGWNNRDAGYDNYRIRYAPMDGDTWTETREYGDDVSAAPIRNLATGTTYEFELLACVTHFLGRSDCTGWQPVGSGAPG
jgi:hypothetical protein